MYSVIVYTSYNTEICFEVNSEEKAMEYAKRIITEGAYFDDDYGMTFLPITQIFKVRVKMVEE